MEGLREEIGDLYWNPKGQDIEICIDCGFWRLKAYMPDEPNRKIFHKVSSMWWRILLSSKISSMAV